MNADEKRRMEVEVEVEARVRLRATLATIIRRHEHGGARVQKVSVRFVMVRIGPRCDLLFGVRYEGVESRFTY